MCRITVEVDQEALMGVNPALGSTAAIRSWAQELIDHRTQELLAGDAAMMDLETVRENLHQMVREVYAQA